MPGDTLYDTIVTFTILFFVLFFSHVYLEAGKPVYFILFREALFCQILPSNFKEKHVNSYIQDMTLYFAI